MLPRCGLLRRWSSETALRSIRVFLPSTSLSLSVLARISVRRQTLLRRRVSSGQRRPRLAGGRAGRWAGGRTGEGGGRAQMRFPELRRLRRCCCFLADDDGGRKAVERGRRTGELVFALGAKRYQAQTIALQQQQQPPRNHSYSTKDKMIRRSVNYFVIFEKIRRRDSS